MKIPFQKTIDAFKNLHEFTTTVMEFVKKIEDDERADPKHSIQAKALRWDWEQKENKSIKLL